MNARHALAAVTLIMIGAAPASATVLSASSQAVGTKSSKADYLKVTTVQTELNATIKDINDATVTNGSIEAAAPANDGPGFILEKDGTGGGSHPTGDPWSVITPNDGRVAGQMPGVRSVRGGHQPDSFNDQNGGRRGGGGGGRHGGGAHGAPEPSTWMLLGAGLALMGGYATLRRRAVIEG